MLEGLGEDAGEAEAARGRGDGEGCDVCVPGEGVRGVAEVGGGGFEFAHYWRGVRDGWVVGVWGGWGGVL